MITKRKDEPVYMIGIAARMLDVHPQTLRLYDREGLLCPMRHGRQRLYSERDIEVLHFILNLTRDMGVNRAGVDIILRMRRRLESLQREVEEMLKNIDGEKRDTFEQKIRRIFIEEDTNDES